MLVQKKISTKKLAIYVSIIFFMLCGTGLMLYQNKKLTTHNPTNINLPIILDNPIPLAVATTTQENVVKINNIGDINQANNQPAVDPAQPLNIKNINQGGGFDLNIFSNDKFKSLQENAFIIKDQPEVGKRDPFKPN
jgi:hypothetical protein